MIESFKNLRQKLESAGEKSREKDRSFDRPVGAFSRFLWPVQEKWLLVVVFSLCLLDYASTFAALRLSGSTNVYEDGPLAGWALDTGGFGLLFIVDMAAAATLSLIAIAARYFYTRAGLKGYARAAFVVALAAYVVRTTIVVISNFVVGFAARNLAG